MRLEDQLQKLAELGLRLNDGITLDDLLFSFDRENFEEQPFDLVLFVLGIEVERRPWGRSICSRVWNFDTECINETEDYVQIVERLCLVAGLPGCLQQVCVSGELESGQASLKYRVNGVDRSWNLSFDSDWVDTDVIAKVMADIQKDGCRFFAKDNGQASILFYLDSGTVGELNRLSGNALQLAFPE